MKTFLLTVFLSICKAGPDVEDYIVKGYTCALADKDAAEEVPGERIVCDDGICSKCVKTSDGIAPPYSKRRGDVDVEDYLKDGYICSKDAHDAEDAHNVCDDGVCYGCRKPMWSGGRGDVEDLLALGYKCFLANDVPKYALAEGVEIVCEDADCFGCISESSNPRPVKLMTLDEYLIRDYSCTITKKTKAEGNSIVCECGKCFECTASNLKPSTEYPVSKRFLDRVEDHLDDGKICGFVVKRDNASKSDYLLCEDNLCISCAEGASKPDGKLVTEPIVDRAESYAKKGYKCVAILESRLDITDNVHNVKTFCGEEVCFICRA